MKLLLSIAPTLLAALVYLNSLHGLLVFDDEPAIVRNMDVRPELVPFGDLWRHDFWGTPIAFSTSNKSYRPLTVASFRWNVGLHGVEYVEGFHGVNVVLHALATALFHLLCLRLLRLGNALAAPTFFEVADSSNSASTNGKGKYRAYTSRWSSGCG